MPLHPAGRQPITQETGQFPGHPSPAEMAACADRLDALALRCADFIRNQIAHIEELCGDFADTATDHADWEQMTRELRQREILWEQQKGEQAEKIAGEAEMLTAAWDEIEAERRRLLTDESNGASPDSVAESAPSAQSVPDTLSPVNLFDRGVPDSGHSAALQFQQIKRDIRQHARRHT